jgi:Plasmid pRiA4b ORF-3-like protein
MSVAALPDVYQLRIRLGAISPLIWRRLLVRSDTSMAGLHQLIQLAFGWTDSHLHRFVIYGKAYAIAYIGGITFRDDPHQVRLADFHFRPNECFAYEYDFHDLWRHEIRLEQILPCDPMQTYPVCTGGARAVPPEECGGPQAFLALRQHFSIFDIAERIITMLEGDEVDAPRAELETLQYWLGVDRFNYRAVNRQLLDYAYRQTSSQATGAEVRR